jgi:hypothetical protein
MNAHFSTPDTLHRLGENATHPSGLLLKALDGVENPRDTHGIPAVFASPGLLKAGRSGASNCQI